MSQHKGMTQVGQATDIEKIAWYAQVWRQADKDAIADRGDVQKQRAEYRVRRRLREAVDIAIRRAARGKAAANAGAFVWRSHASRLAGWGALRNQLRRYCARRRLRKAADGAMRPELRPSMPAVAPARRAISRTPHRQVIIS